MTDEEEGDGQVREQREPILKEKLKIETGQLKTTRRSLSEGASFPSFDSDVLVSPTSDSDEDEAQRKVLRYWGGDPALVAPILEQDTFEYDGDGVDNSASDCEILTDDEEEFDAKQAETVETCIQDINLGDETEVNGTSSHDRDGDSIEKRRETKETSPYDSPPSSPTEQRRTLKLAFANLSPKRQQQKLESGVPPVTEEKKRRRRSIAGDLRSPLTHLRTMGRRAMGARVSKAPQLAVDLDSENEQDNNLEEFPDGSSSEESSYGDETESSSNISLDDFTGDDADRLLNFSTIPHLPCSFLDVSPDSYDYLDSDLVKDISKQDVPMSAWEHHLLVKGLLQLLAERDHIGVEGDVDDSSNILKMGPLKKKFAQMWFVKYVEIRKGNFSYYDDSSKVGDDRRKTIHLRKKKCTCHAIQKDGSSGGFVFELVVEGGPKRLWMAKSEDERQGWIEAINQAMIGETEDSFFKPLDLSPYQSALDAFQSTRSSLQEVQSIKAYLVAAQTLMYRQKSSAALSLPLQWVREQWVEQDEGNQKSDKPEKRVKSSVNAFWKNLAQTSVSINGYCVESSSSYSAERVVGALTRCILEFDKREPDEISPLEATTALDSVVPMKGFGSRGLMTELDAVSYARSILMGVIRSKSRGDAFSSVDSLCRNDELVRVELESSEPLHIDVSFAGDDFSEYEPKSNDVTGWVPTRSKKGKNWKERFLVLSGGVLSVYENADPRPHGLRGQLVLGGAVLNVLEQNILQIQKKEHERLIFLEDRSDFVRWKTSVQRAIENASGIDLMASVVSPDSPHTHKRRSSLVGAGVKLSKDASEAGVKLVKGATGGGIKVIKGATGGGMKVIKGAKAVGIKSFKGASGLIARGIGKGSKGSDNDGQIDGSRRRPTLDMLMTSTRNIQQINEKREPTVQVVVELGSIYKVLPKADGSDDEIL